MQDDTFQDKLNQLISKLQELPGLDAGQLAEVSRQAREMPDQVGSTIQAIRDSADHLRIAVKYLIFDLEATRRENRYLRQLLESRGDDE